MKKIQFSPQMVLSGQNFKYMSSGFSSHVCGLITLSSQLFLGYSIYGLLSLVVNFLMATFLLLPLR